MVLSKLPVETPSTVVLQMWLIKSDLQYHLRGHQSAARATKDAFKMKLTPINITIN